MVFDKKKYKEHAEKRLDHVRAHADNPTRVSLALTNIQQHRGNIPACVLGLSGHAVANAMYEWFGKHSLTAMRQWMYVAARLDQFWYQFEAEPFSPRANMLRLLNPLLSNQKELIDWFVNYDRIYDMNRVEDCKTHDFFAYQSIVALRGDWQRLMKRCDKVLDGSPVTSKEKKYLLDHYFYQALARGNIEKMQHAIENLLAPEVLKGRSDDESGVTEGLIFTPAVIYAKIAWRHGYEVKVDSPYIPSEWLSLEPLAKYEEHYDFLESPLIRVAPGKPMDSRYCYPNQAECKVLSKIFPDLRTPKAT